MCAQHNCPRINVGQSGVPRMCDHSTVVRCTKGAQVALHQPTIITLLNTVHSTLSSCPVPPRGHRPPINTVRHSTPSASPTRTTTPSSISRSHPSCRSHATSNEYSLAPLSHLTTHEQATTYSPHPPPDPQAPIHTRHPLDRHLPPHPPLPASLQRNKLSMKPSNLNQQVHFPLHAQLRPSTRLQKT